MRTSIREGAEQVAPLSEETLGDWEETYSEALGQTAEAPGANQN